MQNARYRILLICLSLVSVCGIAASQPRSVGGIFAFSGIEASYQHDLREDVFLEADAGVDFNGVLSGKTLFPGIRVSCSYSFIFLSKEYESGILNIYAGPGLTAGFVKEHGKGPGYMAGICGNIGLEYRFRIPVALSFGLSPVFGLHLHMEQTHPHLGVYMEGLEYSLYPRVGIRYCF